MIKKQDVLLILEERKQRMTGTLLDDILEVELDVLINKITNLPEEDEWIPIDAGLPKAEDLHKVLLEDCTPYLVQRKYGVMCVAHYIKVYGDAYFEYCTIKLNDVIEWKPLPKTYCPSVKSWKESLMNKFLGGSSR